MIEKQEQLTFVKSTAWPTPQEYNEAVQNLATSLTDPALQIGEPELSTLGLPKPVSGAFASVYRINTSSDAFALRCFLTNRSEQRQRYRKISEHIEDLHQPHTVSFEYQEEGVRIHGCLFPILKMQWVDGLHLDDYIFQNLDRQPLLDQLCLEWKVMLRWLRSNGVAHGDLQHGNVIVANREIKLVDYDGMYVPGLAGWEACEIGHRNYQHPQRSKEHFGPWLDNFAGWSIYTSLYCVSIDPQLWHVLNGAGECLLFRQEDYKNPTGSKAFFVLENHDCEQIRASARLLRYLSMLPIHEVPDLDSNVHAPAEMPELFGPPADKTISDVFIPRNPQDSLSDSDSYIKVSSSHGTKVSYSHTQQSQPVSATTFLSKLRHAVGKIPEIIAGVAVFALVGWGLAWVKGEFFDSSFRDGVRAYNQSSFLTAINCFQRVVYRNPNSSSGWYNLALSYQYSGKAQEAIAVYRYIVAKFPDTAEAKSAQKHLATLSQRAGRAPVARKNGK
jgi:hypothetical protein